MKKFLIVFCVFIFTLEIGLYAQPLGQNYWAPNGEVYATAKDANYTYIGGAFTHIGIVTGNGAKITTTNTVPDMNFPKVNDVIYCSAPDGAGGWYIGGDFTKVGSYTRNRLAHILSDGTVDENWNPDANDEVLTLAISGSNIYLGGRFKTIGGTTRNSLACITTAGALTDWTPNANSSVYTIAISGSNIYVGGYFSSINSTTRNKLACITTDGTLTTWDPNVSSGVSGTMVSALAISGSDVYVGGDFTKIGAVTRNRLACITAAGTLTTWNPNVSSQVHAIAISGSNIYVGGGFTTIGGTTRNALACITTAGTLTDWNPDGNGSVRTIVISGSDIYVGGELFSIGGTTRSKIACITTAGVLTDWNPDPGGKAYHVSGVYTITISGSDIYVGGNFQIMNRVVRNYLARYINSTGVLDETWNPHANNHVKSMVMDGSNIYIGGHFTTVTGETRNRLACITTAGALTVWNPNANNTVQTMAISGDNIYVGGQFTTINSTPRNRLACITTSGTLTGWNPDANNGVTTVATSGSNVYTGGAFTSIGATPRNYLACITTEGTLTEWNPNADFMVGTIVISGSNIYTGGGFTSIGATPRNYLACITTEGTLTEWNPNANSWVYSMAASGSNIYTAGPFTSIGGTTRNHLASIGANGTVTDWNPGANNDNIQHIATFGNDIFIGGEFSEIDGMFRPYFYAGALANLDPVSFTATATATNQINLSWGLNGNSDPVLLAYNTNSTFGIPSGTYNAGDPVTDGGTVLYAGSNLLYNHTGLSPNTRYYYKIWSKIGSDAYSGGATDDEWTLANVPLAPGVSTNTETSLNVTVNGGTNPASTEFAIHVTATGVNKFVLANGTLGDHAVWATAATWGSPKTVTGLTAGTTYTFEVKARNGGNVETVYGPGTQGSPNEQSTITFDSDGGTAVDPITQDVGTEVTAPADPTQDGFTFDGWLPAVPASMPADDLTCVAQWTAISSCGEFWSSYPAPESNHWMAVAYGNGLYVAISENGTNQIMTSPDGTNWTSRAAAASSSWSSITYGDGLFVAVASSGTNRVMTSPDGITWTARTAAAANYWSSVTYGNGLFVAVGMSGADRVMTSPDGINWTSRTAAAANFWTGVTYGNGLFVAVSPWNANPVMTSPDGINWTSRAAAYAEFYSLTYGNGLFVAVSYGSAVITSPDGINWTTRIAVPEYWYSVTYGNGKFVAVAYEGSYDFMTSSDGINWTGYIPNSRKSMRAITFGNDLFVAVAYQGTNQIFTSVCTNPALTLTTQAASSITTTTATGNGNIISTGNENATNRGVIIYPYTDTDKVIGGDSVTNASETGDYGTGSFTASFTGLSVNSRYNTRAHATNTPDGTVYGSRVGFWTLANVPGAPTVNNPTENSLDVTLNVNSNPAATEFAIQDSVNNLYVKADGTRQASAVWQTAATWGTTTVSGLTLGTTYYFRVKARNGGNVETAFSLATAGSPCGNPTDGGTIGTAQTICSGSTPDALINIVGASNYGGVLEYQWQQSITGDNSGFTDIAGADTAGFVPGTLTVTTWFRRLAKVACKPDWTNATSSNVVKITVDPFAVGGSITGDNIVCYGNHTSLLTLTSYTGTVQKWQYSYDDTAWDDIASSSSTTYTAENLTEDTWYRVVVQSGVCPDEHSATHKISVSSNSRISGYVKYENNPHTPLSGLKIVLKEGDDILDSVLTTNTGYYEFDSVPNGNFNLVVKSAHPSGEWQTWGGVNNTDYLLVNKHAAGTLLLPDNPPVIRLAASTKIPHPLINTADATAIRQAAKFPTSGWQYFDIPKWVFSGMDAATSLDSIGVTCGDVTRDIRGLCAGDVNGSYVPATGYKTTVETLPATSLPMAITVYPNPAREILNLKLETLNLKPETLNIELLNLQATKVWGMEAQTIVYGWNKFQMDVSDLAPGVYFLKANVGGEILMKKVLISR